MEIPTDATNLADPLRLAVLHASFRLAGDETNRRRGIETDDAPLDPDDDELLLGAALRAYVRDLDGPGLERFRTEVAGSLLLEIDRLLAAPGEPPGKRMEPQDIPPPPALPADGPRRVGLVSMPWMSPALPSIQLATLASALAKEGIVAEVHELYVDYAARIGLNLYNHLSNLLGYLPEWVFSRHYYRQERGEDLSEMIAARPLADLPWPEVGDLLLEALDPVTGRFLDDIIDAEDWSRYEILGVSLTISQLGASMAFARLIKLRHPDIRIIFGGSQCAGVMGRAVLRICPYVDVVAHVEGELVLPELVRRLRDGASLEGLPGVSHRDANGVVVTGPAAGLYRETSERLPLSYDAYLQRLVRLGLLNKMKPWLPFEGSRGCWYGQKVQCTFCGLHEIMEFRAWDADAVMEELERLYARYGIGRFYAMDLILPREYMQTFLPEVTRRGHDWMFFWEIKANLRREELETLAAAGVHWIQPGIESLDGDLLRLMKKGVSPLQNLLLLKWAQELDIFCGWNLITGLPGEKRESYDRMAALLPKLHHLRPPSGAGGFQLHRFSPYFDHPREHGIRWTGAHPMYRYAFPVAQEDLDDLVYLHDFALEGAEPVNAMDIEEAVLEWRRAYRRGATLTIDVQADGSSVIEDARKVDVRVHVLDWAETLLYLFLDAGVRESAIEEEFRRVHPEAAPALGEPAAEIVARWLRDDLALAVDGRVVALALHRMRMRPRRAAMPREVGLEAIHQELNAAL